MSIVGSGPITIDPASSTPVLFPSSPLFRHGRAFRLFPGGEARPTEAIIIQEPGWYLVRYQFRVSRGYPASVTAAEQQYEAYADSAYARCHSSYVNATIYPLINERQYSDLQTLEIKERDVLYQNADNAVYLRKGDALSFIATAGDNCTPPMKLRDFGLMIMKVNGPGPRDREIEPSSYEPSYEPSYAPREQHAFQYDEASLNWQEYKAPPQSEWETGEGGSQPDYNPSADAEPSGWDYDYID